MAKEEKPPVARNPAWEQALCGAIKSRLVVALTYDDDGKGTRYFAPHAVYRTTKDKICVAGNQLATPTSHFDEEDARNFEVGRIESLTVMQASFRPFASFSSWDKKYDHGVLCAVDRA